MRKVNTIKNDMLALLVAVILIGCQTNEYEEKDFRESGFSSVSDYFESHPNGEGIYLFPDGFLGEYLYYYDFVKNSMIPACGRPECIHNSEECNAWYDLPITTSLQIYEGKIYVACSGYRGCRIYQSDLDGANRKEVCKIDSSVGSVQNMLINHNNVFFVANSGTNEKGYAEYGVYTQALKEDAKIKVINIPQIGTEWEYSGISELHIDKDMLYYTVYFASDKGILYEFYQYDITEEKQELVYASNRERNFILVKNKIVGLGLYGKDDSVYLINQENMMSDVLYCAKEDSRYITDDGKYTYVSYGNSVDVLDSEGNLIDEIQSNLPYQEMVERSYSYMLDNYIIFCQDYRNGNIDTYEYNIFIKEDIGKKSKRNYQLIYEVEVSTY